MPSRPKRLISRIFHCCEDRINGSRPYVNLETGAIFQTVCAACHGFDGRRLDWGDEHAPAYVATEANAAADEVINKILNAHPGVEMVNLRAFGGTVAGDVLTYIASLPQE